MNVYTKTAEERMKRIRRAVLQVVAENLGSISGADLVDEVSRRVRVTREYAATVMWQLIDEGILQYSSNSTVKFAVA